MQRYSMLDEVNQQKPVIEIRDYTESRNHKFTFVSGFNQPFKSDGQEIYLNLTNLTQVLKKFLNVTSIDQFNKSKHEEMKKEIDDMKEMIDIYESSDNREIKLNEINRLKKDIIFKNRSLNKLTRFSSRAFDGDLCIHKRCGIELRDLLVNMGFDKNYTITYRALNNE